MRTRLFALLLVVPLLVGSLSGCSRVMAVVRTPDPVQVVVLATDAVNVANQLGELVEQMRASAHKLHQARVLPLEADNAVQRAAIEFANAKDRAVTAIASAQTALQITAAAAPLVGSASTITAMLTPVANVRSLGGTSGLLSGQLGPQIDSAKKLVKLLGGQ